MDWDPSIIFFPPLFSWEESKSQPPDLGFTQASEQLVAAFVRWHARPNHRGCVMAGHGLCYLFWVCALDAHTDSTGPDSYNPSSELSIQSILITTAVPQLSSSLVAFLAR